MGHEHTGQNDAGDGHGRYGMGEQKNGRQAAGGAHVPRVGGRAGADGRDAALARAGPPVAAEPRAERRRKTAAPLRRWRAGARDGHGAAEE